MTVEVDSYMVLRQTIDAQSLHGNHDIHQFHLFIIVHIVNAMPCLARGTSKAVPRNGTEESNQTGRIEPENAAIPPFALLLPTFLRNAVNQRGYYPQLKGYTIKYKTRQK